MDQRESTFNQVIVLDEAVEEVLAVQYKNMILLLSAAVYL